MEDENGFKELYLHRSRVSCRNFLKIQVTQVTGEKNEAQRR